MSLERSLLGRDTHRENEFLPFICNCPPLPPFFFPFLIFLSLYLSYGCLFKNCFICVFDKSLFVSQVPLSTSLYSSPNIRRPNTFYLNAIISAPIILSLSPFFFHNYLSVFLSLLQLLQKYYEKELLTKDTNFYKVYIILLLHQFELRLIFMQDNF